MKKLRNKKGFTLTEMLIAVLLLGFVSIMVTVMTSGVLDATVTMREVAQAEILGSEALDNVQGQLRVASKVEIGAEGDIILDIDKENKGYTFGIEDGQIVMGKAPTKEGEVFKGDLLFAGTSYGNLRVKNLQFAGDKAKGSVEVFVEIVFGEKSLWKGSVTVKPLNGITVA